MKRIDVKPFLAEAKKRGRWKYSETLCVEYLDVKGMWYVCSITGLHMTKSEKVAAYWLRKELAGK